MILELGHLGVDPEVTCLIDVAHARRIRTALGRGPALASGDDLPLLWQWAYFTPTTPTAELGLDGHPEVRGPLASFPCRMWAGGEVTAEQPLRVGRSATRRSELVGARETSGRTGDMVIITLEHYYEQDGVIALVERQTLVYRGRGVTIPLPGNDEVPSSEGRWTVRHEIDERTLFRFSAVTFNTHRIHYDRCYATEVEGYPDLVVHGPLTAMLLADDIATLHGEALRTFRFRAIAPLFASQPFWSQGAVEGDELAVRAVRGDGTVAVEATAGLAPSAAP